MINLLVGRTPQRPLPKNIKKGDGQEGIRHFAGLVVIAEWRDKIDDNIGSSQLFCVGSSTQCYIDAVLLYKSPTSWGKILFSTMAHFIVYQSYNK